MSDTQYVVDNKMAEVADWQITPSEKSYQLVKEHLCQYAADMQKAIVAENQHYRSRVEAEDREHKAILERIKRELLDEPNKTATAACNVTINAFVSAQERTRNEIMQKMNGTRIAYRSDNLFFRIFGSIIRNRDTGVRQDLEYGRKKIDEEAHKVAEAVQEVSTKARKLRDAQNALYVRRYEQEKNRVIERHNLNLENLRNEHNNEISSIVRSYETEFFRYFGKAAFQTAYEMIRTTMRQATNYSSSDRIPGAMYLGNRTFTITNEKEPFVPEVVNMFRRIDHPAVSIANNRITVTLPFFRTLEEGYSIFLDVEDAAVGSSNRVMWEYVMKVLMNFPAGQTRPLLLDCDSTTELTDFRVIGEYSGRNLNIRTWTEESDIEAELRRLEKENTNLTASYGRDVAARMQRELLYVVACRNFPRKINEKAMTALTNVITAGSARGFFGIVQGSTRELAMRMDDVEFQSSVDMIRKNCLCIKETADGYVIGQDSFTFENMDAIHANKDSIFAQLIAGVAAYRRPIEKFEDLFAKDAGNIEGMNAQDINTWFQGDSSQGMSVPIGVSGASTVQKYTIQNVAQHGLISGVTGSGKSTLLKTMIVAAMMKYSPDNLRLYLIDFKEGVEFAAFSEYHLPWIKVIALNTQRVFALNILEELHQEFRHRADVMRRQTASHIHNTEEKFPRLWLIFDEVQALLSVRDHITTRCIELLSELVSEGRAMNINVIIASQNFAICEGINILMANMVMRITFKGAPESARILMGDNYDVEQLEQGDPGTAAMNTASGARGQTTFLQVGYLSNGQMKDILGKLSMAWSGLKEQTRIMATYVNQDRNSKFNRLITDGVVEYNQNPDVYELMIGDEFKLGKRRKITLGKAAGENLMVVGGEEETARSVFALSILSALYGELASRAGNVDDELIRVIDMSDEYALKAEYLSDLTNHFGRQIKLVHGDRTADMINDTYRVLKDRMRGRADSSQRLFLMIFGMDSLNVLRPAMVVSDEGDKSLNEKLLEILRNGPEQGINCILWTRTYDGFRSVIDLAYVPNAFNKRIYFGDERASETILGMPYEMKDMGGNTVAYRDMQLAVPNAFRVFELPDVRWLESLAAAYRNFQHKM